MEDVKDEVYMSLSVNDIGSKVGDKKEFSLVDVESVHTKFGKRWRLSLKDSDGFRWYYWASEKEFAEIFKQLRYSNELLKPKIVVFIREAFNYYNNQKTLKLGIEVVI